MDFTFKIFNNENDLEKRIEKNEKYIILCDDKMLEILKLEKFKEIFENCQFLVYLNENLEEFEYQNCQKIFNLKEIEKNIHEIIFEKKKFVWGKTKNNFQQKYFFCGFDQNNLEIKELSKNIYDINEGIGYSIYRNPIDLPLNEEKSLKEQYINNFLQPEELFSELIDFEKIDFVNDFENSKQKVINELKDLFTIYHRQWVFNSEKVDLSPDVLKTKNIEELCKLFINFWSRVREKYFIVLNNLMFDKKYKEVSLSLYLLSFNYNFVQSEFNYFSFLYRTDRVLEGKDLNLEEVFVNKGFWATTKDESIKVFKRLACSYITITVYNDKLIKNGFFSFLDISSLSEKKEEKEVLLLPFCQFRIKNIKLHENAPDELEFLMMETFYSISQNFFILNKKPLLLSLMKEKSKPKRNLLILDELYKNKLQYEGQYKNYCYLKGANNEEIGNLEIAKNFYEETLKIERKHGKENNSLSKNYNNIAEVLSKQGNYNEAIKYYQKALEIQKKIFGEDHEITAVSYNNIGQFLEIQGKYKESFEFLNKAGNICKKIKGENHIMTATCYNNLGLSLMNQGKFEEAKIYFEKTIKIRKEIFGEEHYETAIAYNNFGDLLINQGKYSEAKDYLLKSLGIFKKIYGEEHLMVATVYNNLGNISIHLQNHAEGMGFFQRSLQIKLKILGKEHSEIAECYQNIGALLFNQNKYFEAIDYFQNAIDLFKKLFGEMHAKVATVYQNYAFNIYLIGSYQDALYFVEKAYLIRKQTLGEAHADTLESKEAIEYFKTQTKFA